MGRGGGDQEGYSILLKFKATNEQDELIPKYGLNIVHGYYIKSNEQLKF